MGAAALDAAADDDAAAAAGAAAVEGGVCTVTVTVAVAGVGDGALTVVVVDEAVGGALTGNFGTALTTSVGAGVEDPELEDGSSVTGPRVFESKM